MQIYIFAITVILLPSTITNISELATLYLIKYYLVEKNITLAYLQKWY